MAGLRLYHPEHRTKLLLIPHPGNRRTGRLPKDYYIRLDETGHVIVSEKVWSRLQECHAAGFRHGLSLVNVVEDPPPQTLHVGPHRGRVPEVERLWHVRGKVPAAIEDMKRTGIIPKWVIPRIARRKVLWRKERNDG